MFLFLFAEPLYLDNAATTFCDPAVIRFMDQLYRKNLGNPNSQHTKGREARLEIAKAEEILKRCVNGDKVIWTCDATQANILALSNIKGKVITCATEHKSLLKVCPTAVHLPVDDQGKIDLKLLEKHVKGASLVSLMAVNNETGVIHPLAEIGALCRQYKVPFHVDATAAFGKMPLDMKALGIDMISIGGHKFYGPQGIGALIVNGDKVAEPFNTGTLPTVLCAGLGKAAEIAYARMDKDYKHAAELKEVLWKILKAKYPNARVNGSTNWPYILNVRIPKQGKDNIPLMLSNYMIFSAGSACATGTPSHVLTAMGIDMKQNHVIRFSFGRFNDVGRIKKLFA